MTTQPLITVNAGYKTKKIGFPRQARIELYPGRMVVTGTGKKKFSEDIALADITKVKTLHRLLFEFETGKDYHLVQSIPFSSSLAFGMGVGVGGVLGGALGGALFGGLGWLFMYNRPSAKRSRAFVEALAAQGVVPPKKKK